MKKGTFYIEGYGVLDIDPTFQAHIDKWIQSNYIKLSIKCDDISLDTLKNDEVISVRAYTCLSYAQIHSLRAIVSHYNKYKQFLNIVKLGAKTNIELLYLCSKLLINSLTPTTTLESLKAPTNPIPEVLSEIEVMDSSSRFVVRHSLREILVLLLCCRRWGEGEYPSLSALQLYTQNNNDKFIPLSGDSPVVSYFPTHFQLPILLLIEIILKDGIEKEFAHTDLLTKAYPIFENTKPLSKSLIRKNFGFKDYQINSTIEKQRRKILSIFHNLSLLFPLPECLFYIKNKLTNDCYSSGSSEILTIIKEESSLLSGDFLLHLLKQTCMKDYLLIGSPFDRPALVEKKKNDHSLSLKHSYIITPDIKEYFDFNYATISFYDILTQDYYKDHLFNIFDFINNSSCWYNGVDFEVVDRVVDVMCTIILYEFKLCADTDYNIIIKASKKKSPKDTVYDILKERGNPMHLDEIFDEVNKRLPGRYHSATQLRSPLIQNGKITVINRKSVYALKEWDHVQTGTIREAIIDFLESQKDPQKVRKICKHVLPLFPDTNEKNIRSSMSQSDRFVAFVNDYYGLANKKYPKRFIEYTVVVKTIDERIDDLEVFFTKNRRYPFLQSEDKSEVSLQHWLVRVKYGDVKLNESQEERLKAIFNTFKQIPKNREEYEWGKMYQDTITFVATNKKMPQKKSSDPHESAMAKWLARLAKGYTEGIISEEKRINYINIVKQL